MAFSLLCLVAGFALLVVNSASFAELHDGMDADESMGRFDDAFSAAVARDPAVGAARLRGDHPAWRSRDAVGHRLLVIFALLRAMGSDSP